MTHSTARAVEEVAHATLRAEESTAAAPAATAAKNIPPNSHARIHPAHQSYSRRCSRHHRLPGRAHRSALPQHLAVLQRPELLRGCSHRYHCNHGMHRRGPICSEYPHQLHSSVLVPLLPVEISGSGLQSQAHQPRKQRGSVDMVLRIHEVGPCLWTSSRFGTSVLQHSAQKRGAVKSPVWP